MQTLKLIPLISVAAAITAPTFARELYPGQSSKTSSLTAAGLILRISARTALHPGEEPAFKATLTNRGRMAVVLVQPGDGSQVGWRTPLVAWSVLPAEASGGLHPAEPPILKGPRCGNLNPLRPEEVFEIRPGETRELKGSLRPPELSAPGGYRVAFYYRNDPAMKWHGVPDGTHDPEAMHRVNGSTPCALVSNELLITRQSR